MYFKLQPNNLHSIASYAVHNLSYLQSIFGPACRLAFLVQARLMFL